MIRILFLLLLTVLCSCTEKNDEACATRLEDCRLVDSTNIEELGSKCKELGECMHADYEVVHFARQKYNPYACSITKKSKNFSKGHYFYPRGEITFGQVYFNRLDEALNTCHLMTETGNFSDQYYKNMRAMWKRHEEENKRKKEEEAAERRKKTDFKIREEK